jgi:hypothetical protein
VRTGPDLRTLGAGERLSSQPASPRSTAAPTPAEPQALAQPSEKTLAPPLPARNRGSELPHSASVIPEPPNEPLADETPDIPRASGPRAITTPEPPAPPAPTVVRWSQLVELGHYEQVLREAQPVGIAYLERDASDLMALGDAARFERQRSVAAGAYEALRRRFPGVPASARAAFLLGRLAEDEKDYVAALRHYEAYDIEQPDGALAAAALGRRVALTPDEAASRKARCSLIDSYRSRFPGGPLIGQFASQCH